MSIHPDLSCTREVRDTASHGVRAIEREHLSPGVIVLWRVPVHDISIYELEVSEVYERRLLGAATNAQHGMRRRQRWSRRRRRQRVVDGPLWRRLLRVVDSIPWWR